MPSARDACVALWQQAQRSPSIIGFNVSGDLADSLSVSVGGRQLRAADVRLWEGVAAAAPEGAVFLELLFLDVPAEVEEQQLGEACREAIVEHFRQQCMCEFREQLTRQKAQEGLRRRGGAGEDGGEEADAGRRSLGELGNPDPRVRLHVVTNIGGRGRRVLACRTSMTPEAARQLGCLAYPRLFREQSEEELQAQDRLFNICYYSILAAMACIFVLWLVFLVTGKMKVRRPQSPGTR
mmetsp:Transcript_117678/g.379798  ORF Transcript_117678/g.379798 Transcript_117678/m.379798 type:complete len:238 (+) Transcript_117678:62-775(+)